MSTISELQGEIAAIKKRNQKVEADKAWETSLTRRLSVAISTYVLIALFMSVIGVSDPFVSALIPTAGYLLSTVSLGFIKEHWLRRRK